MLSADQLASLDRVPGAILTLYLNTQPDEPGRHLPVPNSLIWLRKHAKSVAEALESCDRAQFESQLHRVETFLAGRHPHEKALAIFAGSDAWQLAALPVAVQNDLKWGRPAVSQLLLLTEENRPYCVVVVDKKKARFLRFQFAELSTIEELPFAPDVSQWKEMEMGHVTGQGVRKTRGSQRDAFDHRVRAQYARACGETAHRAASVSRKDKLAAIFLVGASHLVELIAADISPEFHESLGFLREDLGGIPIAELGRRLAGPIHEWEKQRAESLVRNLLGENPDAVTEADEVLAQLQEGAISRIVVVQGLSLSLHECERCGWADRSADPVCPKCGAGRHAAMLKEVLPRLASRHKSQLVVISGTAAERLREVGGIGGWHRAAKRAVAR